MTQLEICLGFFKRNGGKLLDLWSEKKKSHGVRRIEKNLWLIALL